MHEGVPKWKLALAIGAPVAVGLAGIWWYRSRRAKKVEKEPQPGTSGAVNAENVGQQGDAGLVSVCQNQNDAVIVVWDFFDKWLTDKGLFGNSLSLRGYFMGWGCFVMSEETSRIP